LSSKNESLERRQRRPPAIKDLPAFSRPREKLVAQGPEALSDVELLAILLGSGIHGQDVLQVAHAVLRKLDGGNEKLEVSGLLTIAGVGLARACQLIAALEFSRRRLLKSTITVREAKDVLPFLSHIAAKRQEHFLCISLNGANEVIGNRVITIGLLNSSQVHPREVFADAISDRAAAVILAHNHPSGQLQPSDDDLAVTRQLTEAGKILGITVLDHLIITPRGYFSFSEENLL